MSESAPAMASAVDIYAALVGEFDAEGYAVGTVPEEAVFFRFCYSTTLEGGYIEDRGQLPIVEIKRPDIPRDLGYYNPVEIARASPDPVTELIVVAHELGHHHSYLRGTYSVFDPAKPHSAYSEEVRAWRLARKLLEERSFENWTEFDSDESRRLEGYRLGVSLTTEVAGLIHSEVDLETASLRPLSAARV